MTIILTATFDFGRLSSRVTNDHANDMAVKIKMMVKPKTKKEK
jgi:hypothetical protein